MVAYKCIWVSLRILDDAKTKKKHSKKKQFGICFFFFTEAKLYCNPLTRTDILLLNSKKQLLTCDLQATTHVAMPLDPLHITRIAVHPVCAAPAAAFCATTWQDRNRRCTRHVTRNFGIVYIAHYARHIRLGNAWHA